MNQSPLEKLRELIAEAEKESQKLKEEGEIMGKMNPLFVSLDAIESFRGRWQASGVRVYALNQALALFDASHKY